MDIGGRDDITTILLGAGSGQRMGGLPKALLRVGGATLMEQAVQRARILGNRIILALRSEDVVEGEQLLGARVTVLPGGATRQETVALMLREVVTAKVLIHDVARAMASPELYLRVTDAAAGHDAVALALPVEVRDAYSLARDGMVVGSVDRTALVKTQTPQVYTTEVLRAAIAAADRDGFVGQSLIDLVHRIGVGVHLIDGEESNVKITYPWDIERGRADGSHGP
ncbi:IspD/TarI family cytidylyltransferase [Pinisolibacter sp.]|uniref:IspD/TarI family cytidylyltransferase n=1 Tax=Pinisolibacter sp. TaxID=2172024 RepID=UPI002FDEDF74